MYQNIIHSAEVTVSREVSQQLVLVQQGPTQFYRRREAALCAVNAFISFRNDTDLWNLF